MPKSLYSDNAKNLVLKDAVQVVTLTVSPLTGEMFTIDSENYIVAGFGIN